MNKTSKLLTFIMIFLACNYTSFAQIPAKYQQNLVDYRAITIDVEQLKNQLREAPMKGLLRDNRASNVIITLPLPNGENQTFKVIEAPILSPELSSQRPAFKSYAAQGVDDPTATVRFNITPVGFYAVVAGINGISYIEQIDQARNNGEYITFYDHHIINPENNAESCQTVDRIIDSGIGAPRDNSCFQIGGTLRTYDIVLTCSGEFYQLNGNTDMAVETALMNRMAQVNTVYEKELAVTFTIVEYLLNSDPATDPYANPSVNNGTNLNATEDYINNNVTVGSWDIGHGFHEITCGGGCGWGGIAGLGVVCTSSKGRGYTYLPNDIPNSITVLLHEFGHQFSCRHTNYGCGTTSNCGRYEPGRGSSIMSTSAGCSGDDFFANRTDYFGVSSLQAALDFISTGTRLNNNSSCSSSVASGWSSCFAGTATGNNPPSSNANANSISGLTIPNGTPFTLTGSGSDADGTGSLTYTWEQYDTDYAGSLLPDNAGGSTTAPLFRSFPPSATAERTCPQLTSILAGNVTAGTGEILPTVARTLTWRLTVRDNALNGGGVACDEIAITVGADGPFQITSQNAVTAWSSGATATVTWDVANTNMATYTCPNVDILYSSDGGTTFSQTLASNVANDGSQDITVPATATTTGRIKIVCTGGTNIFFDINDVDIAVISGCTAEGGTISNSAAVTASAGDAALNLSLCAGTPITSTSGVLDASDPSSNLAVENNGGGTCIALGNSPRYETLEFSVAANASVTFTRTGQADYTSMIALYENSYDPNNECTNWLNSNGNFSSGTVFISGNFTESLVVGTKYVLLPSAFSSTVPSVGNYLVNFSATVYDASSVTPTGFLYTYVIVNTATGRITAIDANSDLSNAVTFPAGDYAVHGLSYQSGTALNGYVSGLFTALQADLTGGTICGDLSTNSVAVTIQGPLPIELIGFNGKLEKEEILLDWKTATEIDNDYFIIEKSVDGLNFETLGTVRGSGNTFTPVEYNMIDKEPAVGVNYYRLTQVDFDGTAKVIDKIVAINYYPEGQISVQPNPTKGNQLQLIYETNSAGDLQAEVYSITGQLILQLNLQADAARNVYDINLKDLSDGIYIIRTTQQSRSQSLRFVKTGE